jgi:hypothetical protein
MTDQEQKTKDNEMTQELISRAVESVGDEYGLITEACLTLTLMKEGEADGAFVIREGGDALIVDEPYEYSAVQGIFDIGDIEMELENLGYDYVCFSLLCRSLEKGDDTNIIVEISKELVQSVFLKHV